MLPIKIVEQLFARLLVRYGAKWIRMWDGIEDMTPVHADWAEQLHGFTRSDLEYALSNLPSEFPPTVGQFRELCRRGPAPTTKRLPPPKPNPEKAREAKAGMSALFKPQVDRFAWAKALERREAAGEHLTPTQRQDWRQALSQQTEQMVMGEFFPIDDSKLPPGMRKGA